MHESRHRHGVSANGSSMVQWYKCPRVRPSLSLRFDHWNQLIDVHPTSSTPSCQVRLESVALSALSFSSFALERVSVASTPLTAPVLISKGRDSRSKHCGSD